MAVSRISKIGEIAKVEIATPHPDCHSGAAG
jgi:hypothetical protein